jgi:FMN phosphatase YigB (HAD superfamily)
MSKIKFVYFDIGDVVFNWKQVLTKLALMSKKSYEEVYAVYKEYDDDVCRGKIMPQELWEHFQKELQLSNKMDNFLKWWSSNFSPIPAMHEIVVETSEKYKVGILTNIYTGIWKYYVKDGLIPEISYAAIVQSCDIGFVKPEIEIFKYAQSKAGVFPQEILFIDNALKNVDRAKELGWQAILYDVNNPQKSVAEIKQILGLN